MPATCEEVIVASDLNEEPREMDGNILRKEFYSSVSLATRVTIIYDNAGAPVSTVCEDI